MNDKYNKLLTQVKRQYKNTNLLFDLYLENYHTFNIYIRLDYYKKLKCYRLSWIDLAHLGKNNIDSVISHEYLPLKTFEQFKNIIKNIHINKHDEVNSEDNIVTVNNYIDDNKFSLHFNRYIPKEISRLFNALIVLFDNLPIKLNGFLQEMAAEINGNKNRYEYRESFNFDLFNDDLEHVFEYEIIERGEKYFEENRVFFLEKIKDEYYAVVGGQELYVITIAYDAINKMIKSYCSCPCEFLCKHLVAVILAIRNNHFRNFYKLTHKGTMLDKVMNFSFVLSIGIDDQGVNYLIIEDGQIKLLSIKNKDGLSEWEILEDDDKNTITNRLKEIL